MMNNREQKRALATASAAAREVGELLRKNLRRAKRINHTEQHDVKLDLDVRSQKLIERKLRQEFPEFAVLGEEGITGEPRSTDRWVVDPIDGTVNFTHGIPHACVSIALQHPVRARGAAAGSDAGFQTTLGVVYDPFTDELFSAIRGQTALLNGKPIAVSGRTRLEETIIAVGFAKSAATLDRMLPLFNRLVYKVRKVRMMGAAALALVYVAAGRFDAYLESEVRLWDIAAGGLILECAGGEFWNEPVDPDHAYRVIASNGKLRKKIGPLPGVPKA